jgi:hypothetical protein
MASTPNLRNGNQPSRATHNTSTNPTTSLAEQGARWIGRHATDGGADARPVRTALPRHLYVEPADLEKYLNDDPLVGTRGAAIILGLSSDLLKKWRTRDQGPDYYQYGQGGPVLYSVRALSAFKTAHLVTPGKKGRK